MYNTFHLCSGLALTLVPPASAAELPLLASSFQLTEPANALSLPTWAIHVSSVVEWIAAMSLVWQYGEESALFFIYQAVDEAIFERISIATSAKAAWDILQSTYQG
ncbi:hypothetical protein ACOSQ4_019952 [Xanthoceras sorbifolium]